MAAAGSDGQALRRAAQILRRRRRWSPLQALVIATLEREADKMLDAVMT